LRPWRRYLRVYPDKHYIDHRRTDLSGSELFNAGIRPAVNVGLSVSRVGRSAQHPAMRPSPAA
jgi:hypothetical protein